MRIKKTELINHDLCVCSTGFSTHSAIWWPRTQYTMRNGKKTRNTFIPKWQQIEIEFHLLNSNKEPIKWFSIINWCYGGSVFIQQNGMDMRRDCWRLSTNWFAIHILVPCDLLELLELLNRTHSTQHCVQFTAEIVKHYSGDSQIWIQCQSLAFARVPYSQLFIGAVYVHWHCTNAWTRKSRHIFRSNGWFWISRLVIQWRKQTAFNIHTHNKRTKSNYFDIKTKLRKYARQLANGSGNFQVYAWHFSTKLCGIKCSPAK